MKRIVVIFILLSLLFVLLFAGKETIENEIPTFSSEFLTAIENNQVFEVKGFRNNKDSEKKENLINQMLLIENPNTFDNIMSLLILIIISLTGAFISGIYLVVLNRK